VSRSSDGRRSEDGAAATPVEERPAGPELNMATPPAPVPGLPLDALPTIRSVLLAKGVDGREIDAAERSGALSYLVIDHFVLPEPAIHNLEELAAVTGMDSERIAQLWGSLGFPDPRGGERIFTEIDADMLHTVGGLMELGLLEPDLAIQMSRVIGSSMARVAGAMVDALGRDSDEETGDDADFSMAAGTLLPTMPRVLDYVWRRHLQAFARRRMTREAQSDGRPDHKTVGFADLVGFTALSQQIDEHQLAALVDRFEAIAYDTVVRLGGRVVKMIGDEVMFVVDDVRAAAEIALSLAELYGADEELSEVRVGLARGPTLEREADYYGPVVNRASRIVNIAFPGSVVVSDEVHELLADDPDFAWRSLKHRRLKDIGRVALWSLRWAADAHESSARERARRRHAERQERQVERLALGEEGHDEPARG